MQCPWSKQACFLFGVSLTGGMGRLNTGESNKYIDINENGIIIKGSNLFIDGTEVIVNEETLLANNLIPTNIEYSEEQKQAIAGGIIAGLYQPEERPVRWAWLTFMVDEETIVELPEDTEVYEKGPNYSGKDKQVYPDDSSNWPPPHPDPKPGPEPDSDIKYKYIIDDDIDIILPDTDGTITLYPDKEYIIIGGSNVELPTSNSAQVDTESAEINVNLSHTINDYINDQGEEMTMIEIPIGHNLIRIHFLASDKTADGSWYRVGANITIEAIPTDGWKFVQWTIDESLIVTDEKYSFTVNNDSVYRAKFRQKGKSAMDGYEVVTSTDPANPDYVVVGYTISVIIDSEFPNGIVTGAGSYEENATISLIAVPKEGYQTFWYLNDKLVCSENVLTIIVDSDKTYTVRFKIRSNIPYITDGLVGTFDTLANKGFDQEYDTDSTTWINGLNEYPVFEDFDARGFIASGKMVSFDAIDNTGNGHDGSTDTWTKIN